MLTDFAIRNAKTQLKTKKLSDGGGLQLWIQPTGAKLWRVAYRFRGKQKLFSVGAYPIVTLAEARASRDMVKRLLHEGTDPSSHKKQLKLSNDNNSSSFRHIADEYVNKLKREERAPATLKKVTWLLSFALADFGDAEIDKITPSQVLHVLRKVEGRGRYETARRIRSTVGSVFRYAIATTRAENDPTFALKGALVTPTITPRAAIVDKCKLGGLLRAIADYEGQPTTRYALQLLALLYPRPGELRLAAWSEFDLKSAIWVIPETRTKMRRSHRLPLPRQAVSLLIELHKLTGDGHYLFPSIRSRKRPISNNTLNASLRRLGYTKDEATAHGFRATASTLLNESGKWHPDAIERALGHVEQNEIRRAYARGEHWDERVQMAQTWADFLDELRSCNADLNSSMQVARLC